jgi:hypothetical protein
MSIEDAGSRVKLTVNVGSSGREEVAEEASLATLETEELASLSTDCASALTDPANRANAGTAAAKRIMADGAVQRIFDRCGPIPQANERTGVDLSKKTVCDASRAVVGDGGREKRIVPQMVRQVVKYELPCSAELKTSVSFPIWKYLGLD